MPGPTPKKGAVRRNTANWIQLPADGRKGPTPDWPLSTARKMEAGVWVDIWSTPQAVMWERLGWTRTVARYVRMLYEAEKPDAKGDPCREARALETDLGLTPKALKGLQWEVVADEIVGHREAGELADVRRLRAVDST